jgi:hypothetical protein
MSTTPSDANFEPRWQTYFQAVVFAAPAVIAWAFACVYLVPKLREICYVARLEPTQLGWLWRAPWFLVRTGQSIWITPILIFAILELFGRGRWARDRRVAVSIIVWVVNVIVLFGLTALLILGLVAGSSLSSPR